MQVIDGLSGGGQREVIVNTRNGASLDFLDPDDIVEVPARSTAGRRVAPLAGDPGCREPAGLWSSR